MENVIKQLMALDENGRSIVSDANIQAEQILKSVPFEKEQLEKEYERKENEYLSGVKNRAQAGAQKSIDNADCRYSEILSRLENNFQQNKEEWVEHIVDRCLKI